MSGRRGRICFFAPGAYPVAVGSGIVGGAEVQQWVTACALAERGFDVSVVTADYGQEDVVVRDGVSLRRAYAPASGLPGLRFFYPRLWKSFRALLRCRADVYVVQGSGLVAGWAYDAARLRRAGFVFISASDGDAMQALPWLSKRREKWWYLRALRGADVRVAQTERQRQMFDDEFAVATEVVSNPAELPTVPADAGANDVVLWLSTYKLGKRPEWFTELARRLPQFRFVMAGAPPENGEGSECRDAAEAAASELANLEVQGFVEHDRVGDLLHTAAVFVHTSPLEGFPMVLLEAWAHGVPTVTAVDPDGVITRHELGTVASDLDELVQGVATLMTDRGLRRAVGQQARTYVEQHHGPERTYDPLAAILDRLVEQRRHGRSGAVRQPAAPGPDLPDAAS